jgi:hypothetical protein
LVAYTGRRGAQGTDYAVIAADGSRFRAETTRPLLPGEGLSVAIAWPGGAIYPRFEPPAGLSPAAARFIRQQGFDDGCLTAAILSMAVKGALTIRETGKGLLGRATYALQPQGRTGRRLSRGEVAAYLALFAEDDAPLDLKPDKKNGARVDLARAALQKALRDEHVDATFRRNARERVSVLLRLTSSPAYSSIAALLSSHIDRITLSGGAATVQVMYGMYEGLWTIRIPLGFDF